MNKLCHIVINIELCLIITVLRVLLTLSDGRTAIPSSKLHVNKKRGFVLEQMIHKHILQLRH